jgi:hypothetical protein
LDLIFSFDVVLFHVLNIDNAGWLFVLFSFIGYLNSCKGAKAAMKCKISAIEFSQANLPAGRGAKTAMEYKDSIANGIIAVV